MRDSAKQTKQETPTAINYLNKKHLHQIYCSQNDIYKQLIILEKPNSTTLYAKRHQMHDNKVNLHGPVHLSPFSNLTL